MSTPIASPGALRVVSKFVRTWSTLANLRLIWVDVGQPLVDRDQHCPTVGHASQFVSNVVSVVPIVHHCNLSNIARANAPNRMVFAERSAEVQLQGPILGELRLAGFAEAKLPGRVANIFWCDRRVASFTLPDWSPAWRRHRRRRTAVRMTTATSARQVPSCARFAACAWMRHLPESP